MQAVIFRPTLAYDRVKFNLVFTVISNEEVCNYVPILNT